MTSPHPGAQSLSACTGTSSRGSAALGHLEQLQRFRAPCIGTRIVRRPLLLQRVRERGWGRGGSRSRRGLPAAHGGRAQQSAGNGGGGSSCRRPRMSRRDSRPQPTTPGGKKRESDEQQNVSPAKQPRPGSTAPQQEPSHSDILMVLRGLRSISDQTKSPLSALTDKVVADEVPPVGAEVNLAVHMRAGTRRRDAGVCRC